MGQVNIDRIENIEERYTYISPTLDGVLKEIDTRTTGADCYLTITRVDGLITKMEYYADAARTIKRIERTFSRTAGSDNVLYITGIITIFYNDDGSEDSRVTSVLSRDVDDDWIDGCDNVFSTGESEC